MVTEAKIAIEINGKVLERWNKLSFARAMSDGNLPGWIETWEVDGNIIDPDGILWEDENSEDGDDLGAWVAEDGDDHDNDAGDVVAEIDVTSDVHSLHILEQLGDGSNVDISYPLPATITIEKIIRIKYEPISCFSAASHVVIKLMEGATVGPHILITGDNSYSAGSSRIKYSTDGGTTWTATTSSSFSDQAFYYWIKLTSDSTFHIGVSSDTTEPSYGGPYDMDDTLTDGVDTIQITTPAAAHGYEGFESYADAAQIITTAFWNTWNANAKGDFVAATVGGSQRGYKTKIAGAPWTTQPIYTFGTAAAAACSYSYKLRLPSLPSASVGRVYTYNTTPAISVLLYWDTTGQIYVYNNAGAQAVGAPMAINTDYTITIAHPTNSTFTITYAGTTYGPYTTYLAAAGWPAYIYLKDSAADANAFYIADIVTSWAAAGPDVDPIEAYIYELWTDEDVGEITMSNCIGKRVDIYSNDKLAWRAYIAGRDKKLSVTVPEIKLLLRDEFYPATKHDTSISNVLYQGALSNIPTLNEVPVTPDIPAAVSVDQQWCVIRHNDGTVYHDDVTRGGVTRESAEVVSCAFYDSTGQGKIGDYGGTTYALAETLGGGSHCINAEHVTESQGLYWIYTAELAEDTDEVVLGGRVRFRGAADHTAGAGRQRCDMYAYNYDTGTWVFIKTLGWAPGGVGFEYNIPQNADVDISAAYITSTGGNWQCQIKFKIEKEAWFGLSGATAAKWYCDLFRVDIKCKAVTGYVPIEARVDSTDAGLDKIDINSIPFAVQNAISGDTIMITKSVRAAMIAALVTMVGVALEVGDPPGAYSNDDRSNNGFETFKNIANLIGVPYFLDVQEDGSATLLYCDTNKTHVDFAGIVATTEIQAAPGWGRDATNTNRVTVQRTDQVGAYVNLQSARVAGAQVKFDTVYYLLADTIDDEPDRTLHSIDIYIYFKDNFVQEGSAQGIDIYFPGSDDPDSGPHLHVAHSIVDGVQKVQALFYGDSGIRGFDLIPMDAQKTVGLRVVFDYDGGTATAYYRAVVDDAGTDKLADTWTELNFVITIGITSDPARAVTIKDGSGGIADFAAVNACLMAMDIEMEPAVHDGGSISNINGDVTDGLRDENIATLTVIGAKDADGNEMIVGPVVVDAANPDGATRVHVRTGLKSLSEIERYIENFIANYEADAASLTIANFHDPENIYHPGYTYTFTIDGTEYTLVLRTASCDIDAATHKVLWTLEFGKGHAPSDARHGAREVASGTTRSVNELSLR